MAVLWPKCHKAESRSLPLARANAQEMWPMPRRSPLLASVVVPLAAFGEFGAALGISGTPPISCHRPDIILERPSDVLISSRPSGEYLGQFVTLELLRPILVVFDAIQCCLEHFPPFTGAAHASGRDMHPGRVMGKQRYDVVYICDWLPPDFGAVGQYSELFARQMAERGETVVLLGLTTGARSDRGEPVGQGYLRIIKTPARPFDRSSRAARLWWTIKTNTRLLREAWPLVRQARKVMFTGSPPLFLHWIAPANLILRKELVYRITDFHPECAIAERGCTSVMLRMIYALTLFWRRRVTRFEVLGHD
jgi:hypothetical protein